MIINNAFRGSSFVVSHLVRATVEHKRGIWFLRVQGLKVGTFDADVNHVVGAIARDNAGASSSWRGDSASQTMTIQAPSPSMSSR